MGRDFRSRQKEIISYYTNNHAPPIIFPNKEGVNDFQIK